MSEHPNYELARKRIASCLLQSFTPYVSLCGLKISYIPPGLPDHVASLDISGTLITDLSTAPRRIDQLSIGILDHTADTISDFYLRGNTTMCTDLYIYGCDMLCVHLEGMPMCDRIYDIYGAGDTCTKWDFTGLNISTPMPHTFNRELTRLKFKQYYDQMEYRQQAMHSSADEAGISNIFTALYEF